MLFVRRPERPEHEDAKHKSNAAPSLPDDTLNGPRMTPRLYHPGPKPGAVMQYFTLPTGQFARRE